MGIAARRGGLAANPRKEPLAAAFSVSDGGNSVSFEARAIALPGVSFK